MATYIPGAKKCETGEFAIYALGDCNQGRIVAFEDDTEVCHNDSYIGTIDAQEVLTVTNISNCDVFHSEKPIAGSGERGARHVHFQSEDWGSTDMGTNDSRGGGVQLHVYALDDCTIQIYRNHVLQTTQNLRFCECYQFNRTGNYTGSWRIDSTAPILVTKTDDGLGTTDSSIVAPRAPDIIGYASNSAYISSAVGTGTLIDAYSMGGGNALGQNIATTYQIQNQADFTYNGAQNNYNDPICLQRTITRGADIYGLARADGDGGNDSTHIPVSLMRTHHCLTQPAEYVALANLTGAPITKLVPGGVPVPLVPIKTNLDPLAPFGVRDGLINGSTNIPVGTTYISNDPIYMVYQPKGAGAFGSDDDEEVDTGWNL